MLFWLQLHSLLQPPEQQSPHFPAPDKQEVLFKASMAATCAKLLVKLIVLGTGAAPYACV